MSAYLKGKPAANYVIEPAVHKWKKASRVKKGEIHGGNKHDSQHGCQASTCDLQNIKISGVFSLCQSSNHYNSSVTSWFNVGRQGPTVGTPADVNDYKMLSEIDVEYVCLDTDAASTSSNELDCNIGEEGASMSENLSSTKCNRNGKIPQKILSSDLTEEGTLTIKPKLSFCPTVPTVTTELENSRIFDETSAKEDFMKNTEHSDSVQLHLAETILSPCNKTEKVVDVAQTLSHLKSLQNDVRKKVIQSKQNKLRKNKSSSIVYPKESGIETLSKNSEVQRKSSSAVNTRTVPLDNQSEPDSESNTVNKLSNKMYCCALCWSAYVYGKKLEGSCRFSVDATKPELGNIARSPPASQIALDLKSCRDDVSFVKELKNSSDDQKRSTAVPQLKMQGQLKLPHRKRQESNDNSGEYIQNTQTTYILEKISGVGRRNPKGENKPSKRKQKSVLKSVSELKTVRLCNKSEANSPKKGQPSEIQLNTSKEVKSILVDSDMVCITSNESEEEVFVPKNVSKGLPREFISQQVSVSLAMTKLENRKVGKTDLNVSIIQQLNSETTGAIQSDRTKKVLDGAQGRTTVTSLMNDSKKNSVQSEQNKCVKDEGRNLYVHPEQTDKLIRGSVVHSYQDTRPEPPKNNRQKATRATPPDNPKNVLDVAQGHGSLASLKNDSEKKLVQSKKNKFARNKGGSSFVYPEQTGTPFCCKLSYSAYICGEQSNCSHMINKPTENTTQCTPVGRPESTYETIETLASPTLDVNEFNICNKKRRGGKSCSNYEYTSELHLKKKEQSHLTIKKYKKDMYISPKNTFTSTTRDSCLDLHLKTESSGCLRDGGFSLKSDNVGSPLSEQDFKVHMSKEVQPKHPKNKRHLPNDSTGPKKLQRLEVPEARSTGVCPAKSDSLTVQMSKDVQPKNPKNKSHLPNDMTTPKIHNRLGIPEVRSTGVCLAKYSSSRKLEISEQTISSKKALILFLSPMTDKSERKISPENNFKVDIQKVKSYQNSKRSAKMSCTTFHSKKLFPDLLTNTGSQLRTLDAEQEFTKSNKAIENTTSVVKQNSTDFTFLPAVQKVTEETHQEKKKRGKQTQSTKLCISVDGMKTSSAVRRKSCVLHQKESGLHIPLESKKAAVDSSLSVWKNSTNRMGIEQHTNSMNVLHKVAPSTSDVEVKSPDASCSGGLVKQSTLNDKTCIKQCVLQLCRLAVPLEQQFLLGNVRETCKHYKVQGKADAEKQAK